MATVWETREELFHRRYICVNNTSEVSYITTLHTNINMEPNQITALKILLFPEYISYKRFNKYRSF
jgi:hypothetical protein